MSNTNISSANKLQANWDIANSTGGMVTEKEAKAIVAAAARDGGVSHAELEAAKRVLNQAIEEASVAFGVDGAGLEKLVGQASTLTGEELLTRLAKIAPDYAEALRTPDGEDATRMTNALVNMLMAHKIVNDLGAIEGKQSWLETLLAGFRGVEFQRK